MADAARNYLRTGQEDPSVTVELLYQAARDALTEMRALIYQLRPAPLEGEGLITALRKLADATQARHGLVVEVRQAGLRRLPPEMEDALFRIAQEALHNAVKHAQAGRVVVELRLTEDEAALTVADDGGGFDPAGPPSQRQPSASQAGLGLVTMRERAEQLGGCLTLNSVPHSGTQVEARLPLRREGEHGSSPSAHR
jgi:signal transduction histidine kinase